MSTTEETQTTETPSAESTERGISLGPLATLGGLLVAAGIVRRRKLALAAGLGAIWLDQRSKLGRSLKDRFKDRVKAAAKTEQPAAPDTGDASESSTRA